MTSTPSLQHSTAPSPAVRLIASPKSWIEGEAMRQLNQTALLEGMRLAVGFPDLHPGKGAPVGAAFVTEDVIYPHLIGGDIGCGMALFKTDLVRRDAKLDRWAGLRFDLEHRWEGDVQEALVAADLRSTEFDAALGTIGGGNHFAELQCVEKVYHADEFKALGLSRDQLVVLVHSGSRGLGDAILRDYLGVYRADGRDPDCPAGTGYLREHNFAVSWARANRGLIARRFAAALGAKAEPMWDGCHNNITPVAGPLSPFDGERDGVRGTGPSVRYVHRKGAVAADQGLVVIPGSRGSHSYLVKPLGDGESRAWSLAHGAGRKWCRSESRARMRERFRVPELAQTPLGSRVVCEDRELLYEEAPATYKNIERVIQDLVEAGVASVIATLRPLLTYKTRVKNRTE